MAVQQLEMRGEHGSARAYYQQATQATGGLPTCSQNTPCYHFIVKAACKLGSNALRTEDVHKHVPCLHRYARSATMPFMSVVLVQLCLWPLTIEFAHGEVFIVQLLSAFHARLGDPRCQTGSEYSCG